MREAVEVEVRRSFTPKFRADNYAKWGKVCCVHGCEVTTNLELDHLIPRALGGKTDHVNVRPMCYEHHKKKTKEDRRRISKAQRLAKKNVLDSQESGVDDDMAIARLVHKRADPKTIAYVKKNRKPWPKRKGSIQGRGFDKGTSRPIGKSTW